MKISVCIATYNGEKYIQEQLDSILNQIDITDEIIISDDSSTDNTINIIESYNDSRIKIYTKQKFRNPSFNFENALRNCSGDIIFLSDQDDVWADNKVEFMLKELQFNDLVLSDFQVVDEFLSPLFRNTAQSMNLSLWNVFYKNPYTGCCMAFKRNVLQKSLPFPNIIPMHDMWIGLIASLYFKPIYIPDKLLLYRRHSSNISYNSTKSKYNLIKKIGFRLNLFKALVYVYLK